MNEAFGRSVAVGIIGAASALERPDGGESPQIALRVAPHPAVGMVDKHRG